jgi:hypothetical protein
MREDAYALSHNRSRGLFRFVRRAEANRTLVFSRDLIRPIERGKLDSAERANGCTVAGPAAGDLSRIRR